MILKKGTERRNGDSVENITRESERRKKRVTKAREID